MKTIELKTTHRAAYTPEELHAALRDYPSGNVYSSITGRRIDLGNVAGFTVNEIKQRILGLLAEPEFALPIDYENIERAAIAVHHYSTKNNSFLS